MQNRTLADLDRVVALGGGHGLGRLMSALSSLGSRLTGIVTTTDNGGSTGRIRRSEGGIAWGDTRNCLNQLIAEPSVASAMFEYRFSGNGELSGHNLGNLMLKALDHLSVRPLEAINLVRSLLKVDATLIPMSEQPVDLVAYDHEGNHVYGEVNVDQLINMPRELMLSAQVTATREALEVIAQADVILIGPGSFLTSLMPLLLLDDLTQALRRSSANMIYIDNLGRELSVAAASLPLKDKLVLMEEKIGRQMIDALIVGPGVDTRQIRERVVIQQPLEASDIPHRHDRQLLRQALDQALVGLARPRLMCRRAHAARGCR
ncbi:putative transferase with NAD(P)-binding Rossmann-fold domain [Serratia symbiotica str. Tucson]|uniref:Putative gluconeogenesis factor n=2 Tax=Serratia symbiotica TaxID=138074 RepID=E9CKC2_9GAMM|nr:uridine diphosphate-N-acetylglucosamine-binding protein YvcK [Serratia symbiotica]EFW13034.1 putative transferase with NAD(P)-binding Rossmann-fold domain [Serratia symbiotica str. Tucson]BBI92932.1 gluconeogenesis factor [Serratia symbiotica]